MVSISPNIYIKETHGGKEYGPRLPFIGTLFLVVQWMSWTTMNCKPSFSIQFCFPMYDGLPVLWNNDQAAMFVIILS